MMEGWTRSVTERTVGPITAATGDTEVHMGVHGIGPVHNPSPMSPSRPAADVQRTSETKPIVSRDAVEISPAGKMLENLSQSSDLRAERLAQIKAAIEAGEYETPDKLEAALARLVAEIERDDAS